MNGNIEILSATLAGVQAELSQMEGLCTLLRDIKEGRTHVILMGHSCVTVAINGSEVVVKPQPLMEARKYTKQAAIARVQRLNDVSLFRVVPISQAATLHRQAMTAGVESVKARMNAMTGGW